MTFIIGLIILALAAWIMYAGARIEKEQYVKYLDFIIVGQMIQQSRQEILRKKKELIDNDI